MEILSLGHEVYTDHFKNYKINSISYDAMVANVHGIIFAVSISGLYLYF